ncbi:MAG TPA: hypothetical protein VI873_00475 [Candidatus Peribacteraceae bacterium]|nr:hypothetical protein [Candidatus Peribacteraceae bacterium]
MVKRVSDDLDPLHEQMSGIYFGYLRSGLKNPLKCDLVEMTDTFFALSRSMLLIRQMFGFLKNKNGKSMSAVARKLGITRNGVYARLVNIGLDAAIFKEPSITPGNLFARSEACSRQLAAFLQSVEPLRKKPPYKEKLSALHAYASTLQAPQEAGPDLPELIKELRTLMAQFESIMKKLTQLPSQ